MKRTPNEIKGAILMLSSLIEDIGEELDSDMSSLNEEEFIEKIEILSETNSHYQSVLLTLLWTYGKVSDEQLLFGKSTVIHGT